MRILIALQGIGAVFVVVSKVRPRCFLGVDRPQVLDANTSFLVDFTEAFANLIGDGPGGVAIARPGAAVAAGGRPLVGADSWGGRGVCTDGLIAGTR